MFILQEMDFRIAYTMGKKQSTARESRLDSLVLEDVPVDAYLKKIWKESFVGFYAKHSGKIWRYIFKICRDKNMTDDIFQETFYRYLKAAPIRLNENQQKAYLYKIAFRLIVDLHRRLKVERRNRDDQEPVEVTAPDLSLSLDMEKTFQLLKPKERTLLWLAYIDGNSHREISYIMGIKEKSVKVLLARVRKKFSAILRRKGFDDANNPARGSKK